jgi:hypothetical protein
MKAIRRTILREGVDVVKNNCHGHLGRHAAEATLTDRLHNICQDCCENGCLLRMVIHTNQMVHVTQHSIRQLVINCHRAIRNQL